MVKEKPPRAELLFHSHSRQYGKMLKKRATEFKSDALLLKMIQGKDDQKTANINEKKSNDEQYVIRRRRKLNEIDVNEDKDIVHLSINIRKLFARWQFTSVDESPLYARSETNW